MASNSAANVDGCVVPDADAPTIILDEATPFPADAPNALDSTDKDDMDTVSPHESEHLLDTTEPVIESDHTPSPIRLVFDPPLALQRQIKIQAILTAVSKVTALSSLIDVGCGGTELLKRLSPCTSDALPLTHLAGIDLDPAIKEKGLIASLAPGGYLGTGDPSERWRPLDIKLLHGTFESLPAEPGKYDAVVSAEVIEHLDPEPLANFGDVLLGRLHPKVCIVTTPNREFNALFDALEDLQPHIPKNERFYRPSVSYGMRHDDHRFEWTRKEFRSWAYAAAEKWGYHALFVGAGGHGEHELLNRGPQLLQDLIEQLAENRVRDVERERDIYPFKIPGTSIKDATLLDSRLKEFRDPHGPDAVVGPCTQIAVFVPDVDLTDVPAAPAPPVDRVPAPQQVAHHVYAHTPAVFPPPLSKFLAPLLLDRLRRFLPPQFEALWSMPDRKYYATVASPERFLRQYPGGTKRPWEVETIEVVVPLEEVWEKCFRLQEVCRGQSEVLEGVLCTASECGGVMELMERRKMIGLMAVEDAKKVVVQLPELKGKSREAINSWRTWKSPKREDEDEKDIELPDLAQTLTWFVTTAPSAPSQKSSPTDTPTTTTTTTKLGPLPPPPKDILRVNSDGLEIGTTPPNLFGESAATFEGTGYSIRIARTPAEAENMNTICISSLHGFRDTLELEEEKETEASEGWKKKEVLITFQAPLREGGFLVGGENPETLRVWEEDIEWGKGGGGGGGGVGVGVGVGTGEEMTWDEDVGEEGYSEDEDVGDGDGGGWGEWE